MNGCHSRRIQDPTGPQNGRERGFEWCMTVAGLSISETADLLRFSPTTISEVYWERSEKENFQWDTCVEENAELLLWKHMEPWRRQATPHWANFSRVRIWHKQNASCPLFVQAGCVFCCCALVQQDNAPCHKPHTLPNVCVEHVNDSITVEHLWDGQQPAAWCHRVSTDRNLWGVFHVCESWNVTKKFQTWSNELVTGWRSSWQKTL